MTFLYATKVRMHDTDAAGVIYFANQFRMAHEAYEAYLDSVGISVRALMESGCALPVVHAEADYTAPIQVGDTLQIQVSADAIGETSYKILYRFLKGPDVAVGSAQTVHVCIDLKTRRKKKLPDPIRAALKKIT